MKARSEEASQNGEQGQKEKNRIYGTIVEKYKQ